ncbi:MAG: hypothetical protein NTV82_13590 [Candidatus Aminicenantes bacterium]|nr:hypothetical protein [Candidatus Aminicenantes bacterium]
MGSLKRDVICRDLLGKVFTYSHQTYEFTLRRVQVYILEMEDVLFHHNSAVMMPENPKGKSSKDGSQAPDGQENITGIKALALVFKHFEFYPDKKMIIAGHTDTSGQPDYNFALSKLRAQNVLCLVTGEGDRWADICYEKQKIEDYQQILKYFADNAPYKWPCDPGDINDSWNAKTKEAIRNFVESYNTDFAEKQDPKLPPLSSLLHETVEKDGQKRWTKDLWKAVFELYSAEMARIFMETKDGVENRRRILREDPNKWVDVQRKVVGCGESFPIDQKEKPNYRSQRNRRVEILFFEGKEAPYMDCPADVKSTHKAEVCPLYYKLHFEPHYIDALDLYAVVYHLSFQFFNSVENAVTAVPEGLKIQAFENETEELQTKGSWKKGVYCLKVHFKSPLDDGKHKSLHFEFKTENQWVYTEKKGATPVIVTKTPAEIKNLSLEQRTHYYDLPALWSSRNYWTYYDGDLATGKSERFEKVFEQEKKLKPLGQGTTDTGNPLIFCLDDIVLLDGISGTQDIKDANHEIPAVAMDLSQSGRTSVSRIRIILMDEATGFLKLYQPDPNTLASSRISFPRNLVVGNPEVRKGAKIIFFRDGFYTIGGRRTPLAPDWEKKGFVVGARAAVRNDRDYHLLYTMLFVDDQYGSTGDYDLHYFHHLHFDGTHPVSYAIYHVSISFMLDTRDPAAVPAIPAVPAQADVQKYVDEGVYLAMEEWNRKRYFLEERPNSSDSTIIRIYYIYDERETFSVTVPPGGFKIDFEKRPADNPASNHVMLFNHANLKTAQQTALGGRSKFLALVSGDENGHWGDAWQWSIRNEGPTHYSLFKLNKSGYKCWNDIFTGVPVTEHGDQYGAHTFAHELGHATGKPDEYVKDSYRPEPNKQSFPDLEQYYIPYSMEANFPSMMYRNAAPRLHHLWYALHKINREIQTASSLLSQKLGGKTFVARLVRDSWDITYTRKIGAAGQPTIKDKMTDPIESEKAYRLTATPLRRLSLELYDVGKDESSIKYFHLNQEPIQYQGVLVVRVLLRVDFSHGAWTNVQKRMRVYDIHQKWLAFGGHYRLKDGAHDMKNIYIHFLPGFTDSATSTGQHYILEFLKTNYPGTGDFFPNAAGTVTVYNDATADQLVTYFLNAQTTWKAAFAFLRDWVNNKLSSLGENFSLEEF